MTTFDAVPTIAWNVGALPAPFDVSTWPAVPADELSTPVALLSTTPAPRPLNVIVPDEVRPVRLLRVPAIVLAPVIEIPPAVLLMVLVAVRDRKSTRLNSSHANISYAVFCLKKKKDATQDYYI